MYVIFKRSATNWKQFTSNRKIKVQVVPTLEQAVNLCTNWNNSRTHAQIRRGTLFEFMNVKSWNDMKGRKDV